MKYSVFLLAFLAIIMNHIPTCLSMSTSFGGPTAGVSHPRFATHNLTTFDPTISYSKATDSYDNSGNSTDLFSYNGTETLLKRFTDSSLAYNDSSSIANAYISGELSEISYGLSFTQNLHENVFFSVSTALKTATVKNMQLRPTSSNNRLLTDSEIQSNSALQTYLEKLNSKIWVDDKLAFYHNAVGPSLITMGYTKHWDTFSCIDFLDGAFCMGLSFPTKNITPTTLSIFTIPTYNYVCTGIPMQASAMVGVYDWLNIGCNGVVMPFIANNAEIPLTTTQTNNRAFLPQQGHCTVHHKPFLYFDTYIEAEQCIPHLSFMFALSYAKQCQTTYESLDTKTFPNDTINAFPTHRPWEQAYCTMAIDWDFAHETNKNLPHMKFIYIQPIYGKSVIKTCKFAGHFGIEFVWDF